MPFNSEVIRRGLGFGEAPRWHNDRFWYSDFYRHGVFSCAADGSGERREHTVDTQPSGLGWLPNGDLLIVSMTDHRILRVRDGETSEVLDISPYCGFWANDMVTSDAGISYVGNFGFDLDGLLAEKGIEALFAGTPLTNLVVFNDAGDVLQVVPDMSFPNGSAITPDGKTLIVGETMATRLTAFDIAPDGTLSNRRVWAQLEGLFTDGLCMDAEGAIWLACAATPMVARVAEGGEVLDTVTTTQPAYACMLGGDKGTTLYIHTAPTSDRHVLTGQTLGAIEAVDVGVAHAGRP